MGNNLQKDDRVQLKDGRTGKVVGFKPLDFVDVQLDKGQRDAGITVSRFFNNLTKIGRR